jgi:DNA topoisomerase-2
MIMTDQDWDGSHIKGLLVNLFDEFWPKLSRLPGFLSQFRTPIVKASKRGQTTLSFYSMPDYENWKRQNGGGRGWTIKYYKGLGTSTTAEAKEYFGSLRRNRVDFAWRDESDSEAIKMAFAKGSARADARKKWLAEWNEGSILDHTTLGSDRKDGSLRYRDFVNKELILYSRASNVRAIPHMVDGLKPGQRKILWAAFARNLVKEIRVASFAGAVIEKTAYHHGEQSMCGAIISMAQDYVGSNNINLLVPAGQFGTRVEAGKNAASPRYINTYLTPLARKIFRAEDDAILKHLDDDGTSIEPEVFLPIIAMVLVNGCTGIGTGWATFVPPHDPRAVIQALRHRIDPITFPKPLTLHSVHSAHPAHPAVTAAPAAAAAAAAATARFVNDAPGGDATAAPQFSLSSSSPNDAKIKTEAAAVKKEELVADELVPWWRGFCGTVERVNHSGSVRKIAGGFVNRGRIEKLSDTRVLITEIPIGTSIDAYKLRLEKMRDVDEHITTVENETADDCPRFFVTLTPEQMKAAEKVGLHKRFKLEESISTDNMVIWTPAHSASTTAMTTTTTTTTSTTPKQGLSLRVYQSAREILDEFYKFRLPFYALRRESMITKLRAELDVLDHKARFIVMVVADQLKIRNVARSAIFRTLWANQFPLVRRAATTTAIAAAGTAAAAAAGTAAAAAAAAGTAADDEDDEDVEGFKGSAAPPPDRVMSTGYSYLMSLPLWSLTLEEVELLKQQQLNTRARLDRLMATTSQQMWLDDLDELSNALDVDDRERAQVASGEKPKKRPASPSFEASAATAAAKRRPRATSAAKPTAKSSNR